MLESTGTGKKFPVDKKLSATKKPVAAKNLPTRKKLPAEKKLATAKKPTTAKEPTTAKKPPSRKNPYLDKKPPSTLSQLKRIRGQVDGIIKMHEGERSCVDVVHQILAARNSLGSVARNLLTDEAARCTSTNETRKLEQVLKELFRY